MFIMGFMLRFRKLFIVIAALTLVTCSSSNREPDYEYLRLESNPTTLDPALIVDVDGGSIAAKLFNGWTSWRFCAI